MLILSAVAAVRSNWFDQLKGILGKNGYFGRRRGRFVAADRLVMMAFLKNLASHGPVNFSGKWERIEREFFNATGGKQLPVSAGAVAADNGFLGGVFSFAAGFFRFIHTLMHLFFLPAAARARGPTFQRAAATVAITGAFAGNRMGNGCRLHGEWQ